MTSSLLNLIDNLAEGMLNIKRVKLNTKTLSIVLKFKIT